ncbi:hypothetical protein F8388_019943 [Cannabis sativa]|uniref:Uncharacterized protein n=1 Tax=Cannabis sativa TaxID=3483 RepID=A0A7J6H6N8_CANSA|nr:hypothetical protein F8388_019943 [Cannabis sativa]
MERKVMWLARRVRSWEIKLCLVCRACKMMEGVHDSYRQMHCLDKVDFDGFNLLICTENCDQNPYVI